MSSDDRTVPDQHSRIAQYEPFGRIGEDPPTSDQHRPPAKRLRIFGVPADIVIQCRSTSGQASGFCAAAWAAILASHHGLG